MLNRNYRRRQKGSRKRPGFIRAFFMLFGFLLALFLPLELIIRPVLDNAVEMQGKRIAAQVLAEETLRVLRMAPISYGDLIRLERDGSGNITVMETNTTRVNELKSLLEQGVTARLNLLAKEELSIPFGTLLDSPLLLGRGPGIPIRVAPAGVLRTELVSTFHAAGINQTAHRLSLRLTLETTTLLPLRRADTMAETDFLLAETVIVGEVPEYYTNILSDPSQITSDLKDTLPGQALSNR